LTKVYSTYLVFLALQRYTDSLKLPNDSCIFSIRIRGYAIHRREVVSEMCHKMSVSYHQSAGIGRNITKKLTISDEFLPFCIGISGIMCIFAAQSTTIDMSDKKK